MDRSPRQKVGPGPESGFSSPFVRRNGRFSGPLVFAGYGISAQQEGFIYDDYAGIDVRGKVVVLLRKEPRQADADSPLDGTKTSRHGLFATKLANAVAHGRQP